MATTYHVMDAKHTLKTGRGPYRVESLFNGCADTAQHVSSHRTLDAAVKRAVKASEETGEGWGSRVLDSHGAEIDLLPEARRLGLA